MKNDFRTRRKSLYLWCIAWILFLMGSANPTSASPLQNRTVTGTVTSGTDGEALIGVSVQIQERPAVGTITDLDGKYSIQFFPTSATKPRKSRRTKRLSTYS